MDEMAINIEKAGAILRLMHEVIVPDLVIECGRLGHGSARFESGMNLEAYVARLGAELKQKGRSEDQPFEIRMD